MKSSNIKKTEHGITLSSREQAQGHLGAVIWMTGLSGSGKSTLAMEMEKRLFDRGINVFVLDGDNLRHGICSDLGFSDEDRMENNRRVAEVAALFANAGMVCICALISPFKSGRTKARAATTGRFFEVHIDASVDACAMRDPKQLYEKFRKGEFKGLTGMDAPYEAPKNPDLCIKTETMGIEESATLLENKIVEWIAIEKHIANLIRKTLSAFVVSFTFCNTFSSLPL